MTRKPNGTRCCGDEAYYSSADGGRCSVCGRRDRKQDLKAAVDVYAALCMDFGAGLNIERVTPEALADQWSKVNAMIEELIPDDN